MTLKVKKLNEEAIMPKLAHEDDAGYDIAVIDNGNLELEEIKYDPVYANMLAASGGGKQGDKIYRVKYIQYKTGLSMMPPEGYHLEFVARSSVSKYDVILANCLAIGDEGYRGEYMLRFRILPVDIKVFMGENLEAAKENAIKYIKMNGIKLFSKGDKAAQMLIRKTIRLELEETGALEVTARNEGGFGSTGK